LSSLLGCLTSSQLKITFLEVYSQFFLEGLADIMLGNLERMAHGFLACEGCRIGGNPNIIELKDNIHARGVLEYGKTI